MSMPIQRQSESFGIFDSGPRPARDRSSVDLPKGLAGLINTTGPRITAGLLNTRQASCDYCGKEGHDWQVHPEAHADVAEWERERDRMEFPFGDHREATRLAVNTDGMDPASHAYGGGEGDPLWGEFGHDGYDYSGVSRGEYDRWIAENGHPEDHSRYRRDEIEDEDDESGYNWGPDPSDHLHPDDFDHAPQAAPFDTPIYNPRSSPYDNITGSRLAGEHRAPKGSESNRDGDWPGSIYQPHIQEMFDEAGIEPDGASYRYHQDRHGYGDDHLASRHPFDRTAMRRLAEYDDLPPLPDDFQVPNSPEGQPDRSPGWLYRQFTGPHKSVWDIPEHELNDRWNRVYDALGFDSKTRQDWESSRHTNNPNDKWDGGIDGMFGGGVKDYLTRAPMSKEEYARHREHSQNRAKELADGLWNAMYPPEEEEGRVADRNMNTINDLLNSGWQPEHIKYDENDEPYALYQHPSGWNVKDYGGTYKNIGHAATPGEDHDVISVSRYDRDSGSSHNDLFGPRDAHNFIEEQLHGDPEETGGTFQYLTQNHPAIRRYKPRQARRVALTPQDPAMAPQMPVGGGFLPAHRVGLDWRERTVPGTVIANDGQVHIRWDDGQYTSEDPNEVHLL